MRKSKYKKILITLGIILIYLILKLYVLNTPTQKDDPIPDVVLKLLTINQL